MLEPASAVGRVLDAFMTRGDLSGVEHALGTRVPCTVRKGTNKV